MLISLLKKDLIRKGKQPSDFVDYAIKLFSQIVRKKKTEEQIA